MIVKTDAIVLKSMRYRETSKIVTFYTRRYGKLAGIAKGAREMKSKFGGTLEPMTAVALVLYKKEQRDLQLISQCDILKPFKKIHGEMERMSIGMSIVELVNQLTHDEEQNPALYGLLEESLDVLEKAQRHFRNLFFAFELRLCSIFGFAPDLDRCVRCARPVSTDPGGAITFQLDKGGLLCASCRVEMNVRPEEIAITRRGVQRADSQGRPPAFVSVRASTAGIMRRLSTATLESVTALEYPPAVGNELDATLRSYLRYHFEDLRPLRSAEIFEKIANGH